ncbi:hypothetical protein HanPI659440_Chr00c05g0713971 [Helianthus annuus]|nr:hypothetical protein HanPI659440_Chr00c05g0713971 [Helianthus annuus]
MVRVGGGGGGGGEGGADEDEEGEGVGDVGPEGELMGRLIGVWCGSKNEVADGLIPNFVTKRTEPQRDFAAITTPINLHR